MNRVCEAPDCDKPPRSRNTPYCEKHYYRLRRTGSLVVTRTPGISNLGVICPVDDCGKPAKTRGMCAKHYTRYIRHGDPHKCIAQADRAMPRGPANHRWLADDVVNYRMMHLRLRKARGSAKRHKCPCGRQAIHWAYDHLDQNEHMTPDSIPFSVDFDHYVPRCASCHKKLDHAYLRQLAVERALWDLLERAEEEGNGAAAAFICDHLSRIPIHEGGWAA